MQTVKFKTETSAMGRNGSLRCTGVHVTPYTSFLSLRPITSKDTLGNCYIEIPNEAVQDVCDALGGLAITKILDRLDKATLPTLMGINKEVDKLIEERL